VRTLTEDIRVIASPAAKSAASRLPGQPARLPRVDTETTCDSTAVRRSHRYNNQRTSMAELDWRTDPNGEVWRRRPDLNRGWSFCRALPYHLATAPDGTTRQEARLRAGVRPRCRVGATAALSPFLAEGESWSGKRDSNPRLRPWQGRTLPLSYSRSPERVAASDSSTDDVARRKCPHGAVPSARP